MRFGPVNCIQLPVLSCGTLLCGMLCLLFCAVAGLALLLLVQSCQYRCSPFVTNSNVSVPAAATWFTGQSKTAFGASALRPFYAERRACGIAAPCQAWCVLARAATNSAVLRCGLALELRAWCRSGGYFQRTALQAGPQRGPAAATEQKQTCSVRPTTAFCCRW